MIAKKFSPKHACTMHFVLSAKARLIVAFLSVAT